MTKLIELLNEYDPEYGDNLWGYAYRGNSAIFTKELAENYITSKSYGFIKWLYKNNHIDMKEIVNEAQFFCEEYYNENDDLNRILMLLAINDKPIEFLNNILK